jgi:hypothetical protein
MAGTLFILELALIVAGCAAAFASLFSFGGAARNRVGLLALGLYLLAFGAGVTLIPQLFWPVAREDNAFLGQFLLSLLLVPTGLILTILDGVQVVRQGQAGQPATRALLFAAGGTVLSLGLIALRGPEPWQTRPTDTWDSGTFGFAIIAASIVIGIAVFFAARSSGWSGNASSKRTARV